MPFYQYNCPTCNQIELFRKMTDPEFKICPTCNSEIVRDFSGIKIHNTFGGSYNATK